MLDGDAMINAERAGMVKEQADDPIEAFDNALKTIVLNFEGAAQRIDMPFACYLDNGDAVAQQEYPGIYRIDIATTGSACDLESWFSTLKNEWDLDEFRKKFTPTLKKKRMREHDVLRDWMPFYLGKSKNIAKRVYEHINLELDKSTFALKLVSRGYMVGRKFRLCTLKLNVDHYDVIAPILERILRDKFNPITGKQ